jgi:flagellin-like protein
LISDIGFREIIMRKITKVKRSIRAISPVIATLLMIAIAVVASLVVYAWVIGYIGGGPTKASNSMLIQSTSHTDAAPSVLVVYVQNVGQGTLELKQTQSVYVNSILKGITASTPPVSDGLVTFPRETTATLITDYPYTANEKLKIKITATDGTFAEYTTTGTSGSTTGTFGSHTITASSGSGAHISPTGSVTVAHGGGQTFQMSSDNGYHISDVLIDGTSIGAQITYKFTNVDADHTISATSAATPAGQQMILATAGPNGVITPSGQVFVSNGASQAFQIRPDAGYHIADVLVDETSKGQITSYTFTGVTTGHTISATFQADTPATHTITVNSGTHGTISPGTGPVNHGTDKTYTITADSTYLVDDVVVDGTSIGSRVSYTFENVVTDHTISATFISIPQNRHIIHASAGANGQISPIGDVVVQYSQTFTITPDIHYHVADVLVDGTSKGPITTYSFTGVTSDHTISATFAINTLTITASAGTNGQISPSGSVTVNYGADQTFNIQPNTGYLVADVLIDGSPVGSRASYTFTNVIATHTISASFTAIPQNTHVIQASASAHGTISPAGSVTVTQNNDQAFTITPESHYHISDVLVDGTSVGAKTTYTFTNVIADHTISATFAADTLRITASAGQNGQISPSGSVTVNYGSDQSFTITPASGYIVGSLTVDGAAAGFGTSYTFTNVVTDHTIAVAFTPGSNTEINTGFDSDPWDANWHAGGNPPWFGAIGEGVGGTTAAKSDIGTDGAFTSNQISTTSGKTIRVTFMYKVLNTINAEDFVIAYSFANNPDLDANRLNPGSFTYISPGLGTATPGVWHTGSITVTSQQYFSFRFESSISYDPGGLPKQIWVDNVIITVSQ